MIGIYRTRRPSRTIKTRSNTAESCKALTSFNQSVKELHPSLGTPIVKSLEGETAFIQQRKKCEMLFKRVKDQDAYDKLTEADKGIYDKCEEGPETCWDFLGPGCSRQEQHFKLEQTLGYGDRSNAK